VHCLSLGRREAGHNSRIDAIQDAVDYCQLQFAVAWGKLAELVLGTEQRRALRQAGIAAA
jgi:hypothetical protein